MGDRVPREGAGRIVAMLSMLLALAALGGCSMAAKKRQEAVYSPSESVLEVVTVLRRHVPADTYRFPPPDDFSGRNVYRSSLLRLESIEHVHADALRAGHMDAVIAFAKARALERLRAYDLAAEHYRKAEDLSATLRDTAQRSAEINESFSDATRVGIDFVDPMRGPADAGLPDDPEAVVAGLEERQAMLSRILGPDDEMHYDAMMREEIERADMARAHYFVAMRNLVPDGNLRAVSELQRVVSRHSPSKFRRRHLLDLADLYARMAEEYVVANPPESLRFDPPTFQELVDSASQIYEVVAAEDGTPEKLEASRRFEAFLAFTLQVDRDRFTQ